MSEKAWGGRFSEELNEFALSFSASVDIDQRLAEVDILGSQAHARMLGQQGIITLEESQQIIDGLAEIAKEIKEGRFHFKEEYEDVHLNIEAALREKIGPLGGKVHTARSRNDQVATDMRMWVRGACEELIEKIDEFLVVLLVRAENQKQVIMPGYTHLQRAQPVRLSHHLLAWAMMLTRDRGRISDTKKRLNESPLGCAALAGTTFPIDREQSAKELGFDRPMSNSLDATSDRDFLLEFLSSCSICAVHLSRISEELVLWSS
jgi:argininosuccinate lyase